MQGTDEPNLPPAPRILIATVGSLGDLHPFIAVALALQARGAHPILAVPQDHVAKCRTAGVEAHALTPTFEEMARDTGLADEEIVRRIIADMDFLISRILLPPLADSTARLRAMAQDVDVIVGSIFGLAAPIAADRLGIPFVSAVLQPMSWFSPSDPPATNPFRVMVPPPAGRWGMRWNRLISRLIRAAMRQRYGARINAVRTANGLAKSHAAPIAEPGTEPLLSLGLYSPALAPLPADVAGPARLTGFPWFDSADGTAPVLDAELAAFLVAGPPPLIVSLGSFVPYAAAEVYSQSAAMARALGMRAILLTGEAGPPSSADIMVRDYAPHSLLFPHAAAIIHHGGVGTTGQALRAGRPQLIIPFMGDQHDHARRIARKGVGLSSTPQRFAADGYALLQRLIEEPAFAAAARTAAATVAQEDGAGAAADAILDIAIQTAARGRDAA